MLKTALLRILLRNRNSEFSASLPSHISDNAAAVFWASKIYDEMKQIFDQDDVEFLRIQDQCARDLFPHKTFNFRKIFCCKKSVCRMYRMRCCEVKENILIMIGLIQRFILSEKGRLGLQDFIIEQFVSTCPNSFVPEKYFREIEQCLQCICSE